jgi:hypothetical protein
VCFWSLATCNDVTVVLARSVALDLQSCGSNGSKGPFRLTHSDCDKQRSRSSINRMWIGGFVVHAAALRWLLLFTLQHLLRTLLLCIIAGPPCGAVTRSHRLLLAWLPAVSVLCE